VRFDKHKLQAEIERMRSSGEMAATLKRYRDRFVQSHSFDAAAVEAITAKDLERAANRLKLADIADQSRLMGMEARGGGVVPQIDREEETFAEAAARLLNESGVRRSREGR